MVLIVHMKIIGTLAATCNHIVLVFLSLPYVIVKGKHCGTQSFSVDAFFMENDYG